MTQLALRAFQSSNHQVIAFQCFYQHAVLHRFLKNALHFRTAVTHLTCQAPHLAHIHFTEHGKYRQHPNDDECQHLVHREKIDECSYEESERSERVRNGFGEESDDTRHITLQAIDDIAAMVGFPAVPLGTKDAVEHSLLHPVLGFDSENILHPDAGNAQREVTKHKYTHQCDRPIDGPFNRP